MTEARTLDVSRLPDWEVSSNSPLWWGQVLMATIEGCMFCILIAIYFYLRQRVDVWPPPGVQLPHLIYPTLALVPLILSAGGSYLAGVGAQEDNRRKMLTGMLANVLLAFLFLGLRVMEMRTLNFNWATDVHGSIFWTILFLHLIDALGDVLFTVVLIVIVALGNTGPKQRLGVHVDSVVWYFIVASWIPFYFVIYWGPHILGAP